jgi:hypothetical protein
MGPARTAVADREVWPHFNWAAFDQDKVVSFNGYQYTLYWDADMTLVLARRNRASNTVQTLRFPDYTLTINPKDGHRNTVLGLSPEDGRLHLSWDHHNNDLRYTRSRARFLKEPPREIGLEDFEPEQPLLPDAPQSVTYPRFFNDGADNLFFLYRSGGSGRGETVITRYDAGKGAWRIIGTRLFSKEGVYAPWNNSASRNAYPHDILFDHNNRLHITWTFREEGRSWASNHDLHYVYSDDFGVTWKNNGGEVVADLSTGDPVDINDPGIVVREIPVYSWLMNTGSMAIDSKGQPHVATYHMAEPFIPEKLEHNPPAHVQNHLNFYHYWRTPGGKWRRNGPLEIPDREDERIRRPNIVIAPDDTVIIYWSSSKGFRCHAARAGSGWQVWKTFLMTGPAYGVPDLAKHDRRLLQEKNILSITANPLRATGGHGFAFLDFDLNALTRPLDP